MQNADIALLALIALTIVAVALAVVIRHNRAHRAPELRQRFGSEYARVVARYDSEAEARRELRAREKRVRRLNIRLLSPEQCERFGSAWQAVQQRFVDDPEGAMVEANGLVKDVMRIRGYPIGDLELELEGFSVEHANILESYRKARVFALTNAIGKASPEDLRQGMAHYRALFADLLQTQGPRPEFQPART